MKSIKYETSYPPCVKLNTYCDKNKCYVGDTTLCSKCNNYVGVVSKRGYNFVICSNKEII